MSQQIREAAWAGQFYPGRPQKLREMIEAFINQAPTASLPGEPLGLIVPHAGYVYSGQTAATGYKQLQGKKIDTVVVISPSHAEFIDGVSVYHGDAYETPLGTIPVDKELSEQLTKHSPLLHLSDAGHKTRGGRAEHALEVQLPFLQVVLAEGFKLVAAVFHDYRPMVCKALGEALAKVHRRGMLIIASTDLYHGYSYEECRRSDARTIAAMLAGNAESFCTGAERGEYQACGAGPVAALLFAASTLGADHIQLLAQTNSADVIGQRGDYTVGYAALWVGWKK